ncbi:hypothetical protein ACNHUS_06970 [Actinomycetes bacterium M1A6_2h]
MDLFDVFKISARRWYVVLPILLIAGYYAYQSYSNVKPVYYSSVSIGIVLPSVKEVPAQATTETPAIVESNGLADSGGVSLLANFLSIGLKDNSLRSQVAEQGGYTTYQAEVFALPTAGQLPIVVVSSTGGSRDRVSTTMELVLAQAEPTLKNLQAGAGVPESRMASAYPLSVIPDPIGSLPSRTREAGAIAAAGIVIALVAGVLTDAVIKRISTIRRRKSDSREPVGRGGGALPNRSTDTQARLHR